MDDYELELELNFDDYQKAPWTTHVTVESKEHAKTIIKGYKSDRDFMSAELFKVHRVPVDLNED